jgi:A/G-specific adenine glycosylase
LAEADTAAVLGWGLPRLRDLPWRQTRDPWAVLVSEVMLQQTQALRVVPKWLAFLAEFPTPAACAEAPLGDVLRLWQGLGYPRRARNLHGAATAIVAAGSFPSSLEGLLALPGVGQYTARAVMVFAFESEVAVVDTNIARVYARVVGRRLTPRGAQAAADSALPVAQAWAWNQCLMDLGALLCRPSSPGCVECPLRWRCAWHGVGDDPAVGSAGVSGRQARFEGSDRQGRGRLMRAAGSGPIAAADVAVAAGWPTQPSRAATVAASLVADGLLIAIDGHLRLP